MPLTPDQESNVLLVMRCVSPFSMIATLAVILHVTCFNRNRTSLINRFQAYLAVNDFVFCVDFVLGVSIVTNAPLCTIFGFLHEFVDVCGTCLVVCITHLCYKTVERGSKAAAALRWWYFAYSFVTPLLFITLLWIAATILNRGTLMGNATYECWISAAYPELKVAFIYPLLWIHMVVIVIIYTRIYQKTQSSAYELSGIWGSTGYNTTTIASRHERGVDAVLSDNPGLAITVLSGSSTVPPAAKIQTISKSRRPSLTKNDNALSLSLQEHLPPTFPEASLQRKITTKSVKMDTEKQMRRSLNRLILKGSLIAIGFVISWTPATIVRVMQLFNIPVPYWMIVCAGICLAMTGLMNASVYLVMLIVSFISWASWWTIGLLKPSNPSSSFPTLISHLGSYFCFIHHINRSSSQRGYISFHESKKNDSICSASATARPLSRQMFQVPDSMLVSIMHSTLAPCSTSSTATPPCPFSTQ